MVESRSVDDARSTAHEMCRVTVLASGVEVDLTLPATAQISTLIPGIVAVIDDHRRRRGTTSQSADLTVPAAWTLTTLAGVALSGTRSMWELGIHDGDLLVLHDGVDGPGLPVFDDVTYGVAESSDTPLWDMHSARILASAALAVAVVLASVALVLAPGAGTAAAVAALGLSALITAAGCLVGHLTLDSTTALTSTAVAAVPAFVAGALLVPEARIAPDLALGAALVVTTSVVSLRFATVGRATFTALALAAGWTCAAAVVVTSTQIPPRAVSAALCGLAVLGFTWAPRMSMMHSRVPLPPVPVPDSDAADTAPPIVSYEEVRAHAVRARQYLSGYVWALSVVAAGAALACAVPSEGDVSMVNVALAAVVAVVLMLRGRTYVDRTQAAAGIASGLVVIAGLVTCAIIVHPDRPFAILGFCCVAALVAVGAGVVAPGRSFTPVVRRAAELAEFAVVASVIPLVCWTLDLFALVRGL